MVLVSQVNKGKEPGIAVAERLSEHSLQTRAPGVYPSDWSTRRADRTFLSQFRGAIFSPQKPRIPLKTKLWDPNLFETTFLSPQIRLPRGRGMVSLLN